MKILIPLIGLFVSTIATAQSTETVTYRQLSKSIDNDGKMVTIAINGEQTNGQKLWYNRTFNVAGLSAGEQEALVNRILDSLGVSAVPQSPKSPQAGTETVRFECPTCTGKSKLEIHGNGFTSTREFDSGKDKEPAFPFVLNLNPGTYQYSYWQNRVQQMKLPFTVKAGEENVVKVK